MKSSKVVSLLLCVLLLVGLCSFSVAEENWSGEISVAGYMFGPIDSDLDFVTPLLQEKLAEKYDIHVTLKPMYVEYQQYEEIMNTRIAGGTAPDVFLSRSKVVMENYYDQGAIASWDVAFFQENAPTLYEFFTTGGVEGRLIDFVDMFWDYSTIDGKMVTVAKFAEANMMLNKGVIYRGDWLDALDVAHDALPMTIDEYVDLMYRFAKEDPDGNGVDDTYGFSTTMIKTLFGAYGTYSGFIGGRSHWYDVEGKLMNADVFPSNKDVLELCAKLYADGVIDPEFITGENTGGYWAIAQGFINGVYGVSALASFDHYRLKDVLNDDGGPCAQEYWAINGADSEFVYGPWIAGPNGDYGYYVDYPVTIGENAIYNASLNNDPEKLAMILRIMDIFASDDELAMIARYGQEGLTYEYNKDGVPVALLPNDQMNAYGVWGVRSLYGADTPYSETMYNHSFYNDPTIASRLELQSQPQWNSYLRNVLRDTLPSQDAYEAELITFRDETWVSIIKGDLPVDYYDTYVNEYLALGGQVLADEANAWYDAQK